MPTIAGKTTVILRDRNATTRDQNIIDTSGEDSGGDTSSKDVCSIRQGERIVTGNDFVCGSRATVVIVRAALQKERKKSDVKPDNRAIDQCCAI